MLESMSFIIHYGGTVHGRRLRQVPVLVLSMAALGAALTACGSDAQPEPGGSSSAQAAPQSHPAPAADAGCVTTPPTLPDHTVDIEIPAAKTTLDDAGTGTRTALAVRPTRVATTRLFTNSLQVSQVSGEQPSGGNRDVTLPLTTQPSCADPLDVYVFFGAPTSTDGPMTQALKVEDGTVGQVRLTPTGEVRSFRIAAPEGVAAEAQTTFEQALIQTFSRLVPLPSEPVAPGATWTVTRSVRADSTLTQTMKVTLRGTAERPVLEATVDESPDDSLFRVPGSNQTLTIESFTSAGNGAVTIDPTAAFPIAGGIQLEGGRTLVGDDAAKKLTQKTGSIYRWDS